MLAADPAARLLPHLEVCRGVPGGHPWHRVSDIVAEGWIDGWLDAAEHAVGRRDLATSFLGSWIAAPTILATTAELLIDDRLRLAGPDTVYLRAHPAGWFDGVCLADARVAVLPPDVMASATHACVTDREALVARWARQTVDLTAPLLAQVQVAGHRFGLRALWGNAVVDRVIWLATDLAQRGFGESGGLVTKAQELLAALDPLAPVRLPAGRTFAVTRPGGTVTFPVKSCCCLLYKTVPHHQLTVGDYCTGCPLLPDATRAPRWSRYLDQQLPAT